MNFIKCPKCQELAIETNLGLLICQNCEQNEVDDSVQTMREDNLSAQ